MLYNISMINNTTIEICIGNVQDALIASKYPIDRIELNSALELGGLTPSIETLKYLKQRIKQSICCMVRPRGGDFFYTQEEFEVMLLDAKNLLEAKADGIVFGFLHEDKTIDIARTKTMVELIHSYGKEAVFHKASDEVPNLEEAIQILIECGIDRVLTGGKCVYPDLLSGCKKIGELQIKYGDKIQLLPGGGVRVNNIVDVINTCGSHQVHMTSKQTSTQGYTCIDEKQLVDLLKQVESI